MAKEHQPSKPFTKKPTLEDLVKAAAEFGMDVDVQLRPREQITFEKPVHQILSTMAASKVRGTNLDEVINSILENWIWENQERLRALGIH